VLFRFVFFFFFLPMMIFNNWFLRYEEGEEQKLKRKT